jgi:hypothetical protein
MIKVRPMSAAGKVNSKSWVRFPNESYFEKINLDLSEFKPDQEFEDETFGWYKGIYVSVKN